RVAQAAVQGVDFAGRPVVVDDPDRDRVAQLPGDRTGEGVIPDWPMGVADDRGGAVDHAGYLDHDPQVGPSSGEVLANRRLDLAAAERDPILAWNGNLVPPLEVIPGVGDEMPVGMVPKVVAEPACDLRHVVGVSETVIVSLTIRVAVPVTENPVSGLDGLTDELPSSLVALQVVLEPLDPGCEIGGITPGVVSSPLDIALVKLVYIIVETRLDLGPMWAVGMLRKKLPRLVDQVGKRRVGQRFAANQIVNELALDGGPARRQLVFQGSRQCQDLGTARGVRELAQERVELGQRFFRLVAGRERKRLGVDFLPALVVPHELAGLFDLANGRCELRRLLLDPFEAGGKV